MATRRMAARIMATCCATEHALQQKCRRRPCGVHRAVRLDQSADEPPRGRETPLDSSRADWTAAGTGTGLGDGVELAARALSCRPHVPDAPIRWTLPSQPLSTCEHHPATTALR